MIYDWIVVLIWEYSKLSSKLSLDAELLSVVFMTSVGMVGWRDKSYPRDPEEHPLIDPNGEIVSWQILAAEQSRLIIPNGVHAKSRLLDI